MSEIAITIGFESLGEIPEKSLFFTKTVIYFLIGVPKVSFQNPEFKAKISSKYELKVRIQNMTDYPLTTAVKWQRYNEDINITDTRYIGSTEDFFAPKLVINGVDFVNDHQVYYRCVATNSEGSWTASARINVYDSTYFKIHYYSSFN